MKTFTRLAMVGAMTLWMGAASAKDVTQDFKVDGWSCEGCTKKTVAAVKSVEGVKDAKANLDAKTLTVTFDDAKIQATGVEEAVKKAGFGCDLKDAPGAKKS